MRYRSSESSETSLAEGSDRLVRDEGVQIAFSRYGNTEQEET